jgi:uncharacterized protein YacL
MGKKIARIILTLFGAVLIYSILTAVMPLIIGFTDISIEPLTYLAVMVSGSLLGGLILYFLSPGIIRVSLSVVSAVEVQFQRIPIYDIIVGSLGLVIGLIIANLFGFALYGMPIIGDYLPVAANVGLGYLGLSLSLKKRDEIAAVLGLSGKQSKATRQYKVLDTSAIIDGRVADLARTGFLEGVLVVPSFILEELRHIADSTDALRRNRGRRGLDVLNSIQREDDVRVEIMERDFDDILEVDSKLVKLAQLMQAKIITTDYNLNKVCELQGVPVLNINDLANAIKPVVLPGEEMHIQIMREGKESGQGVAYLDDGTMIVVDQGRRHIGDQVAVVVTSVLQTSAGRMIFARVR